MLRRWLGSWHTPALLLLLPTAVALCFHELGLDSVWLDEAHTFQRARLPLGELFDETVRKRHVPTYFVFMHYFIGWVGDSEFWLRFPSALFGVATVAAMYVAGTIVGAAVATPNAARSAGAATGFTAAAATLVAPYQVAYAQEARMYTMVTFCVAVALAGFLWLVREPERAARRPWRRANDPTPALDRRARAAWLAVIGGTTGALLLHNTSPLFAATLASAALLSIALSPGQRAGLLRNWLLAGGGVLLGCAWWIPYLLQQTSGLGKRQWGSTDPKWIRAVAEQVYLIGHNSALRERVIGGACLASVIVFARQRRLLAVVVLLSVLGPALIIGISIHVRPVFLPRTALWTALPLFILLGMGLARVRPLPLAWLLSGGFFYFVWGQGLTIAYPHLKTPNRDIALRLRDQYALGNTVVLVTGLAALPLDYYFTRKDDPVGPIEYTRIPASSGRRTERAMRKAVGSAERVVMVDRATRHGSQAASALAWLDAHGTSLKRRRIRRTTIHYYEMHPAGRDR